MSRFYAQQIGQLFACKSVSPIPCPFPTEKMWGRGENPKNGMRAVQSTARIPFFGYLIYCQKMFGLDLTLARRAIKIWPVR